MERSPLGYDEGRWQIGNPAAWLLYGVPEESSGESVVVGPERERASAER